MKKIALILLISILGQYSFAQEAKINIEKANKTSEQKIEKLEAAVEFLMKSTIKEEAKK